MSLEHPIMNGGGTCRTLEDVQRFVRSAVSAVNVSIVYDERAGNAGDVYWRGPHYSLNALGLPSRGINYYRGVLSEMVRIAHAAGKKLFVNLSAFTPEQYAELALISAEANVDAIEFNFSCPNVKDSGQRKPIFSFYPASMEQALMLVGSKGIETPTGIKLAPISNPSERDEMCLFLLQMSEKPGAVKVVFVTLCNTFPDVLVLDSWGRPVIGVALAGLGGPPMKPIALGHIYQFKANQDRGNLPDYMGFIGSGGVESGQDVRDYCHVGASLVQATTACADKGDDPSVYSDILADYIDVLGKLGVDRR